MKGRVFFYPLYFLIELAILKIYFWEMLNMLKPKEQMKIICKGVDTLINEEDLLKS